MAQLSYRRHRFPAETQAALRLMRKLLKKQGFAPKLLVADKLDSYGSAFRQLRLTCPHEQGLRSNNRAENSHQVVRRRERQGNGSNQHVPPNVFLASMPPSIIISMFNATSSRTTLRKLRDEANAQWRDAVAAA